MNRYFEREVDFSAVLTATVDAVPEAMMVISAANRILAANLALRTLFPIVRIGDPLHIALRSPDVLDAVKRVGIGGEREKIAWRERAPIERSFDIIVAPIAPAGFERAIALTVLDLTESMRVERMRVDFIANASHELRTPLASMLGFVETLQGPARDDAKGRERFLTIMRTQGQRMARLIDDLLSLSRIEQNEHLRPNKPVDLVLVVSHVVDTLALVAKEASVKVSVNAPETLMVLGERDELVRLAENLIENAIKYGSSDAGEPTSVEITIARKNTEAILTVRDFGKGIAAEDIPRLTERFYRVDAGASRAKGGTGLGLAIVKHIVARHRGRLTIESRPGEGALFRIALPAVI